MKDLVEKLIREGVLKTPEIIAAFLQNDRKLFVPEDLAAEAYVDAPLPIGQGQTISQPYTVAFMIELLDPRPGQKILDIGFGSGWTSAILASIVGEEGRVYGFEIVAELYEFGAANLTKRFARGQTQTKRRLTRTSLEIDNIMLYNRSGWEGLPDEAPFDRILVSAAAPGIPESLKDQLAVGGRMVIPVGSQMYCTVKLLKKNAANDFEEQDYPGFAFVPLVK